MNKSVIRTRKGDFEVEKVRVTSRAELVKALKPFLKVDREVAVIETEFEWIEDKQVKKTKIVANHEAKGLKETLIDGFDQVKEQQKMWDDLKSGLDEDAYGTILPDVDIDEFKMPVDRLIEQRLDGKRKGLKVVWNLGGQIFEFDPYTGELKENEKQS